MKKISLLIILIAGFAGMSAIMKEDGRAGATGSPGETTCNTSGCHTGNALNSGGGSITISAPTMTNWEYVPGQVYPISVTVAKAGTPLFGIGFEALRSTGANGGTLSITNPVETQIKSAVIGGNVRTNVVHKVDGGLTSNSHTFTFNWTAPLSGVGNITFYAAGNAANNNGGSSGDFIYTTSQIITESTSGIGDLAAGSLNLQLYPNPSIGKFNIDFKLDEPGMVEVTLVDVTGKKSHEIISTPYPAGEHKISFDPENSFAKGVYLLNFRVNEERFVKRIAIL